MKKILFCFFAISLFSCSKNATGNNEKTDSIKIIDSINKIRTKYNDSIKALNDKNQFVNFEGTHEISHNMINGNGKVNFKKIGKDEYEVSGSANSGNNSLQIKGDMMVVSEKYMNFTGEIIQSIADYNNGKPYTRKGTMSFMKKNNRNWELQNKINNDGFVDYINLKF